MRRLLCLIILLLCGWTVRDVIASDNRLVELALPAPEITGDAYRWQGGQLYMLPVYGACNPDSAHACVQYSYLAAVLAFERAGQTFTVADLLALTYHGELSLFNGSAISIEALGRSLLDTQSGACRFDGYRYDCAYAHIVDYLFTMQHWRDSTVTDGVLIRVNVARLLGDYETWLTVVPDAVQRNAQIWRSGVGASVPSSWGNVIGSTPPPGTYEYLLIHRLPDDSYVIGEAIGAVCTSVAFIVSTHGRLPNSQLGVC